MKFIKITVRTLAIAALVIGISTNCLDADTTGSAADDANTTKANGRVEHPIADFDNQVSEGIVILDFFATWCPPCRRFGPVFTRAAANHPDIRFIKIDIDKYASIASDYGVRSMPTIIVLKDGGVVKTKAGYMKLKDFENWINSIS